WRGYLQGQLTARFGLFNGLVILGLLWSFWHLPLLLAGFNYPENPYLGAFVLSPLLLIGASFFLAWLTLLARSFWPAALAHGAGDSIQGGVTTSIQSNKPGMYVYLTELALIVIVGLISYLLLVRGRKITTHVPVDATHRPNQSISRRLHSKLSSVCLPQHTAMAWDRSSALPGCAQP